MKNAKPNKKPRPPARKKKGGSGGCLRWVLAVMALAVLGLVALIYLLLKDTGEKPKKVPVVTEVTPTPKSSRKPKATPSPRPRATPVRTEGPEPKAAIKEEVPSDFEPVEPAEGKPQAGAIAIVIDDLGYTESSLERFAGIDWPLTISVLPDGPLAQKAADFARRKGWGVMVHLPLESAKGRPEPSTIKRHYSDSEIRRLVFRSIDAVPGATGVNNHQGSLATADSRLMAIVLTAVRDRHLFFLDSRTTKDTVVVREATRLGVSTRSRDVFLDDPDAAAEAGGKHGGLKKEWERALALVRQKGDCVVIGHPHAETLSFLAKEMPAARRAGIRPVRISELVE